jgi:DNA-directed RNA polymerase alpha subunit
MVPKFGSHPWGERLSLKADTPIASLHLTTALQDLLHSLGIRRLGELALARPQVLQRIGVGPSDLRRVSALLEEFLVSLDRSELLLLYSGSLQAWELYLSQAELRRQTELMRHIPKKNIERLVPKGDQPEPSGLKIPIEDLVVSVRAFNCLARSGIANVHELALTSPDQLLKVANLGRKTLRELAGALEEYFSSLEPPSLTIYEESYALWKRYFASGSNSPPSAGVHIRRPRTSIGNVQRVVCREFGLGISQIKSEDNGQAVAFPRQIAMYIAKELTPASLPQIGREFGGKHHTTVLHSINKISELRKTDQGLNNRINKLIESLAKPGTSQTTEPISPDPGVADNQRQGPGLQVPVRDLLLSVRASHCLERAGIENVHELALSLPSHLLKVKNLGRRTLTELANIVERYFDSLEPALRPPYNKSHSEWKSYVANELATESTQPPPVMDVLWRLVWKQSTRNKEVIIRRFGLRPGGRPETLDAIGRSFGLTRERVRQIAAGVQEQLRAVLRGRRRPDLVPLREYLQKASVATLAEVVGLVPAFSEPTDLDFEACVRLLLKSFPGLQPIDREGQLWSLSASVTADIYHEVIKTAKSILRGTETDLQGLALETARRLRCGEQDTKTVRVMIQNATSVFAVQPSSQRVGLLEGQRVHDRRRAFAYDYIRDQGVPIAVSEILDALEETNPDLLPDSPTRHSAANTLRSLLERDDRFAWAGLSTWGLREWGYEAGVTSISQAAITLLRRAGPLTTSEIQETLRQLYRVSPGSIAAALNAEKGDRVNRNSEGCWYAIR